MGGAHFHEAWRNESTITSIFLLGIVARLSFYLGSVRGLAHKII